MSELTNRALQWVERAAGYVQAEVPSIVAEYITWERWRLGLVSLGWFLLAFTLIHWARKWFEQADTCRTSIAEDLRGMASAAVVLAFACTIFQVYTLYYFIQVLVTPRLYVIHHLLGR